MDKKFLSAEEAVAHFGLDPVQFQLMVDEGELRALADRGTWKYRRDEIEGLIEEGLLKVLPPAGAEQQQTLSFDMPAVEEEEPEELSFLELDEEALSDGATVIKKRSDPELDDDMPTPQDLFLLPEELAEETPARPTLEDSVSDVRLAPETDDDFGAGIEQLTAAAPMAIELPFDSTEDLPVAESLSEYEMRLPDAPSPGEGSSVIVSRDVANTMESDSDVKVVAGNLADSDSDVALAGVTEASGILLSEASEGAMESDSDVKVVAGNLADSDSDVALAGVTEASGISLSEAGDGIMESDSDVKIADSGISLENIDSGVTLERIDSGLSLERFDSGISLEAGDSGITLESSSVVKASGDSAIPEDDSGITLDAGDSGLSLGSAAESGISLEAGDSGISIGGVDSGIRLDEKTGRPKRPFKPAETELEIAQFDSQEFDPKSDAGIDQTAMIVLDDDDDAASQATLPPTKGKKTAGLSEAFDLGDEVEDLEIVEDFEAGELDVEAVDEEVEDEEMEDVLEASDEVFLDGDSSELSDEEVVAASAMRSAVAGPKEPSWGIWAVLPVAACALLLAVNGLILWEGVATMWTGAKPMISGALVDSLGGQ